MLGPAGGHHEAASGGHHDQRGSGEAEDHAVGSVRSGAARAGRDRAVRDRALLANATLRVWVPRVTVVVVLFDFGFDFGFDFDAVSGATSLPPVSLLDVCSGAGVTGAGTAGTTGAGAFSAWQSAPEQPSEPASAGAALSVSATVLVARMDRKRCCVRCIGTPSGSGGRASIVGHALGTGNKL